MNSAILSLVPSGRPIQRHYSCERPPTTLRIHCRVTAACRTPVRCRISRCLFPRTTEQSVLDVCEPMRLCTGIEHRLEHSTTALTGWRRGLPPLSSSRKRLCFAPSMATWATSRRSGSYRVRTFIQGTLWSQEVDVLWALEACPTTTVIRQPSKVCARSRRRSPWQWQLPAEGRSSREQMRRKGIRGTIPPTQTTQMLPRDRARDTARCHGGPGSGDSALYSLYCV